MPRFVVHKTMCYGWVQNLARERVCICVFLCALFCNKTSKTRNYTKPIRRCLRKYMKYYCGICRKRSVVAPRLTKLNPSTYKHIWNVERVIKYKSSRVSCRLYFTSAVLDLLNRYKRLFYTYFVGEVREIIRKGWAITYSL